MKTYVSLFVLAAVFSYLLTPAVIRLAVSRNLLDHPDEARRSHTQPVPRLGGVAIYLAFLLTLTSLFLIRNWPSENFQTQLVTVLKILLPCSLIFLLGIYDDIRGANARIKFSVQILASILVFSLGIRITEIWSPFGGVVDLGYLALPVTVLWLVGISNAFNLIDGLDGLSAGAALFALLTVSISALIYGHPIIVMLSLSLAGATLGFLRYNFAPARIFMGDSGSLFLGFALAALSIQGSQKSATAVVVAIPIVSFGLPILDTGWAVLRRLMGQRPVFTGDLEHIHHMMLRRGLSTRQAIMLLYGVCAALGLFSLLFLNPQGKIMGVALFAVGLCVFIGIQHLGYHEAHELTYAFGKFMRQRRTFARHIQIRRAIGAFADVKTPADLFRVLDTMLGSDDFDRFELRLFHITLNGDATCPPPIDGNLTGRGRVNLEDQGLTWSWPGTTPSREDSTARSWTLRVPLVNNSERPLGEIHFQRDIDRDPLQLDTYHFCRLMRDELSQTVTDLLSAGWLRQSDLGRQSQAKAIGT